MNDVRLFYVLAGVFADFGGIGSTDYCVLVDKGLENP